MEIKELKKEKLAIDFGISITRKEIDEKIHQEIVKIAKSASISGFRKGKVPAFIIKKRYGNAVRSDIIKNNIISAIKNVKENNQLKLLGEPNIDSIVNEEDKDLSFT